MALKLKRALLTASSTELIMRRLTTAYRDILNHVRWQHSLGPGATGGDVPLFVRRHPFPLLALLTLSMVFGVEALARTGHAETAAAAAGALRVLIVCVPTVRARLADTIARPVVM